MKRNRIVMGIFVIVVAFIYLLYTGIHHSGAEVLEVWKVLDSPGNYYDKYIEITGRVDDGSVEWNPGEVVLEFDLIGGKGNKIHVVYKDVKPDNFNEGSSVIVKGALNKDGIFIADTLLTQCASKYESKD